MKKLFKSIMALFMACFLFAGCGPKKPTPIVTEDVNELEIYAINAGYRSEFLYKWIEGFSKKYPEIKVIEPTINSRATEKAVQEIVNPHSTVDLWLTGSINAPKFVSAGGSLISGYDCVLEDLTSLYDEKIDGENVTIREKADGRVMMFNTFNNKNYSLSWASGPSGLLINRSFGIEVPKTTDGFVKQVKEIANGSIGIDTSVKPFIFAGNNAAGYWTFLSDIWQAQYDGVAGYDAYWKFKFKDDEAPTYEVLKQQGVLESYKVLYEISDKSYSVYESPQLTHTDAQQQYLRGKAVYMANGDWFETEMKSTGLNTDIVMVKVPVISALGKKLRLAGVNGSDEAHEEKLVAIVTDIDNGLTKQQLYNKYSDVGNKKIDAVWDARHVVYNLGYDHKAYIPAFSNAKTAAKKFLNYICSDEGISIFRKYAGSSMPYKYINPINEERSQFQKSLDFIMEDSVSIIPSKELSPIRYLANPIVGVNCYIDFYNKERTPEQLFDDVYNYSRKRWSQFLVQAGLA